jgi:hypothetical protein
VWYDKTTQHTFSTWIGGICLSGFLVMHFEHFVF